MSPSLRIGLAVALTTLSGAVSANAQALIQNFSFTRGAGADTLTSPTSVAVGTGYSWSVNLSSVVGNGTIFSQSIALPLSSYGINPANLIASGVTGPIPGNLFTRNFVFTDVGGSSPAYNFTVTVDLMPNLTVMSSVNVISLGSFTALGITGSPVAIPISSITVGGSASVTPLVPAPGSLALIGAGMALVMRRRR